MRDDYKRLLEQNRSMLVESIDLKHGLWDIMRTKGLVDIRIQHGIQSHGDQFQQVGHLLDLLLKKDDSAFTTFCTCLKEARMGHIVRDFLTPQPLNMRADYKGLLERNRAKLVDNIDLVHGLWDIMRTKGLVDIQIQHEIQSHGDQFEQVGHLLDHLLKKDDEAFTTFCTCLAEAHMSHIVRDYLTL